MPPKPTKAVSRAISVPAIMSPGVLPSPMANSRTSYVSYEALTAPVTVQLGVKRMRLVVLSLVAIGVVATAVLFFRGGVTIKNVQLAAGDERAKSKLVDQYNSYTGNISAALTKPIELFATMALQLMLLRFAARAVLQPERSWRLSMVSLTAAWMLLYLLLNGFNSLNVQIKPSSVIPRMQASDLSNRVSAVAAGNATESAAALAMVTNASFVVPETTPGNLVTNTILRTAVVLTQKVTKMKCYSNIQRNPELTGGVDFGFATHPWNGKMLPSAPPTKKLTISLASNTTSVNPSDLPMPLTRALRLFCMTVKNGAQVDWLIKLGAVIPKTIDEARKPPVDNYVKWNGSTLLPPSPSTDDADREWFVRKLPAYINGGFQMEKSKAAVEGSVVTAQSNDTEKGVSVSFSHVDLSPRITFDAVTIDAAVNIFKYTDELSSDNKTRIYNWRYPSDVCGPSSVCMAMKELYGDQRLYSDPPSLVLVNSVCDDSGSALADTFNCSPTNTSVLVISIAKKLTADSIDASNSTRLRIMNATKIYSLTVGILKWETEDLAPVFGATCDAPSGCRGLQFPLTPGHSENVADEMLVVGEDALPLKDLQDNDYTPLVTVRDPLKPNLGGTNDNLGQVVTYEIPAGDALLPHNIRDGPLPPDDDVCSNVVERRLGRMLTNHLYMEDGLQPAYMAGLFWLFQNGVAKAVVKDSTTVASASSAPFTLAFDGNIQVSALVASIPEANVWLSLAGCIILAVGVLSTIAFNGQLNDDTSAGAANTPANGPAKDPTAQANTGMSNVTDPRVIAQVMLDDSRFPPMFLNRKVVDTSRGAGMKTMDSFQISSMTLESEHADGSKQLVTAHNKNDAGQP